MNINDYTKTMTRPEFDKFTEEKELCPNDFGLTDTFTGDQCEVCNCKKCYDQALKGITFASIVAMGLPNEALTILNTLGELELQSKSIKDKQVELKADLLKAMESHGIKKWDNELMTITYIDEGTKTSLDSKKIKEELPGIFEKYSKTSNVKSSVRIKLKDSK